MHGRVVSPHAKGLEQAASYWNDKAARSDTDHERVEQSPRAQCMRFEAFLKNHDLSGRSVLDVGCGAGEFHAHLRRAGVNCDYS
jgi:2-polyprenyl-3-methyl-5-hydroxy-6-metoxy-1,4-benzoquinol methylase